MNERYILNSSNVSEYSVEQTRTAQKKTESFMKYLKDFYDYDEVTLYTYKNIDSNTDISIIDYAIRFIFMSKPLEKNRIEDEIKSFKTLLFETFKTIQVVCLTRHYDNHSVNHYLFISSYFQNGYFKIILPMDFNYNVLALSFFDVQFNWGFTGDPNKKYLYDNSHQYAEFVENVGENNSVSFQSVCAINFNVSYSNPILSNTPKNSLNTLNCFRQAQLVLKMIPDYSTDIEIKLLYNRKIIKNGAINNGVIDNIFSSSLKIIPELDKFIFPLAEEHDLIKHWTIEPELSPEFMSQDFEPYWLLKDMNAI